MNVFTQVAGRKTPRSKFNLSHEKKMTMGFGDIIPSFSSEVLPGDKFRVNQEILLRMSPMIAPIMHQIDVWTHYFFVPNRLLWDNWDKFITGGEDGLELPVHPRITINQGGVTAGYWDKNRLGDYLGVPTIDSGETGVIDHIMNDLKFRAYIQIYNEYYRDQNTEIPVVCNTGDGTAGNSVQNFTRIRQRAWGKDYFTSALPWTQRGPESEIQGNVNYKMSKGWADEGLNNPSADGDMKTLSGRIVTSTSQDVVIDNIESLGITVNELRNSTRLQEWLERQARGGGRLTETILSHFGVKSKDQRIQRPEYLGGSKNPISVSEVLNTASVLEGDTMTGDPGGTMYGHGVAVGANQGFKRFFPEHGIVMGLTTVMPKRTYQQGLNKHFLRQDKFDYYWPEFANLGEQPIENQELYFDPKASDNFDTFGYTPRYSEYKQIPSTVHGEFRDTLNHWHLGDIFDTRPNLNSAFLKCRPSNRIFAVGADRSDYDKAGEELYCNVLNRVDAVRPMPYYGTPRL